MNLNVPDLQPVRHAVSSTGWALLPEVLDQLAAAAMWGRTVETGQDQQGLEARTLSGSGGAGQVLVIPIRGVMRPQVSFLQLLFGGGGGSTRDLLDAVRAAAGDDRVGGVVFDIDSPGGAVDLVPELAAATRDLRAQKPVVAVANTMAASAAYWIAAQATELLVSPSGQIGSIGVYTAHADWSRYDDRYGVTHTLVGAGKYKLEGNPYEPLGDEARAAMQATVDAYYGMFTSDVAEGRRVDVDQVVGGFGEGRMVLAQAAVDAGMADAVGGVDQAIDRVFELMGRTRGGSSATATTPPSGGDEGPPDGGHMSESDQDDITSERLLELVASSPTFRAAFAAESTD